MVASFPMKDELYLPAISAQCGAFLTAVLLGALFCVAAALLLALKKAFKIKAAAAFILDFSTLTAFSLAMLLFVLGLQDGRLRWFLLCGAALGYILVRLTLFEALCGTAFFLLSCLAKIIRLVFCVVFAPVSFIWDRVVLQIVKFVVIIVKNIWTKVKICLINHFVLLYNSSAHLLKRK